MTLLAQLPRSKTWRDLRVRVSKATDARVIHGYLGIS